MPLYFAYGSNMDQAAMRSRCPKAEPRGIARLAGHRFVLMGNGWASIRRDPRSDVHGCLFDLALSDIPPLDRYEDVAHHLYRKDVLPVIREGGGSYRALVYVGTDESEGGLPPPGYVEAIVAAARTASLPSTHVAALERLLPGPRRAAFA